MIFSGKYLSETKEIADAIDQHDIEHLAKELAQVAYNKGRLFILGVGGSSSTAGHAVNDFRKICKIESYSITDNVAELTAITNDRGWEKSFSDWLEESNLTEKDAILVFSVGGGNQEEGISTNIIGAIIYAKSMGCKVLGVVGKDGGYVKKSAHAVVVIPTVNKSRITPHVEGFAAVVLHLLVSHPLLKKSETTWELIDKKPCS